MPSISSFLCRKNVIAKILKGDFSFDGRRWNTISPNAKSFVQQMLQSDPMKRPTAEMVSQHLWLKQQEFDTTKNESEIETMDFVQAALRNFAGYGTLKKLALMIIAHKSTSKELGFLRTHFSNYDKEKNGVISLPEFEECVSPYGYTHEEIVTMFQGIVSSSTRILRVQASTCELRNSRGVCIMFKYSFTYQCMFLYFRIWTEPASFITQNF